MSSRDALAGTTVVEEPHEHAAAIAWSSLDPSGGRPTTIGVLKAHHKSGVYRLHGVAPGNSSVVAKHCGRETAVVERLILGDVLPALALSRLDLLGAVDDGPNEDAVWLFMQDAGDAAVTADQQSHVAQWLAKLHVRAANSATVRAAKLPGRGLDHYRRALTRSLERLRTLIPQWTAPERTVAREILHQNLELLEQLDESWATFAARANIMPTTLVHGDFVPRHVRVCDRFGEPAVYVIDWETAGWGNPEIDIACLGMRRFGRSRLEAYGAAVSRRWPSVDAATVEQARRVGLVMRRILAIDWASYSLGWGWDAYPLAKLEVYAVQLRHALRELRATVNAATRGC